MLVCKVCGEAEPGFDEDGTGVCPNCRESLRLGPDVTCAILGRGDQGEPVIRGIDTSDAHVGCCPVCHRDYLVGEVCLMDGRWAEVCCTVQRALKHAGTLRWTPFKDTVHVGDASEPR